MYYDAKIINSSRLISNHTTPRNLQEIAYNKSKTTPRATSHRIRVIISNYRNYHAWCRNQPISETRYL